jgi:hypothetical protein
MARMRQNQTNFTAGVLDEKMAAREDMALYFNGLKAGKNGLILPMGGFTARPGKQFIRAHTRQLNAVSLSGATVTAPQGGTPANVHDGDESTYLTTSNDLATTNPFVVAHIDFGSVRTVDAIDIVNIKLSTGALAGEMKIQYSSDNTAWMNYDTAFDLDVEGRTRRRRASATISARYWRLVRIGATSLAATISVAELKFWVQSANLSDGRFLPFAYSTDDVYMMVASDQNLEVLQGATRTGSVAIPHTHAQLSITNKTQSLDTLLLFHPDVQPHRVFRQGANDEFDSRAQDFENIPKHDYGAGTGGIDEVQTLNVAGTSSGDKFTLLLDGKRTTAITVGASSAATATNIQTALQALENTSATGISVAAVTDGFTVSFGGDDGSQPWGEMQISVLSGNGVWDCARTTEGEYPGEAIMSATRGWPRDGVFYQQRLHVVGFKGVPNAWSASVLGDVYNLDINQDDETRGLLLRADMDQVAAIYRVFAGRHLTFFTTDGEFFNPAEPIGKDAVMKLTTRSGSKEGMPVLEVDGALIFWQGVKDNDNNIEVATTLREFLFIDTEQSYQASPLTKVAADMFSNPVDMARRQAIENDQGDVIVIVNEDGTGVNYTTLRTEEINAFVPMDTRTGDKILACGTDKKRRVYFLTERQINGETVRYIEMWNDKLLFDCGGIETITYQTFTATAGQTNFIWSFDNPVSPAAIGCRVNGFRLPDNAFNVNLGTKTITLNMPVTAGDIIRIARMVNTVTGLDHLEGETIQTYIDGSPGNDYTVAAGAITLNAYADTEIQYGFAFDVEGELMPFRVAGQETLIGQKVRCINVFLQLSRTGGIEIKANDGRWVNVPLTRLDTNMLDRSLDDLLFSGTASMRGLLGCVEGAPLKFRRPFTCSFTLLSITREAVI